MDRANGLIYLCVEYACRNLVVFLYKFVCKTPKVKSMNEKSMNIEGVPGAHTEVETWPSTLPISRRLQVLFKSRLGALFLILAGIIRLRCVRELGTT
jgi:hypothetical protein